LVVDWFSMVRLQKFVLSINLRIVPGGVSARSLGPTCMQSITFVGKNKVRLLEFEL
jgi:hypothetical protein